MTPEELDEALREAVESEDQYDGVALASAALIAAMLAAHGSGARSPKTQWEMSRRARFGGRLVTDAHSGYMEEEGAMTLDQRVAQYVSGLAAFRVAGELARDGAQGYLWRLGAKDHCPDCVALAASGPYPVDELPTTPGMGATICRHNCGCSLVRAQIRSAPSDVIGDVVIGASAAAWVRVREVGDLELQAIYLRRAYAQTGDSSYKRRLNEIEVELSINPMPGRWQPGLGVGLTAVDRAMIAAGLVYGPSVDVVAARDDLRESFGYSPLDSIAQPAEPVGWDRLVASSQARHVVGDGESATLKLLDGALGRIGGHPDVGLWAPDRVFIARAGFVAVGPEDSVREVVGDGLGVGRMLWP